MDIPRLVDALWAVVAPLLPPWSAVPRGLGSASPATCWRRLRDWQQAGVWDAAHRALLDRLGSADKIAWERACLDSASVPARRGAKEPGATRPTAASPASGCTS